jgi:hypothetical protein
MELQQNPYVSGTIQTDQIMTDNLTFVIAERIA